MSTHHDSTYDRHAFDSDHHDEPATRAIVLAGGRGRRLAPYTSVLPKPLMPIGDRSILEIVVEQLERHGFRDLTFSVGYLSHLIRAVFDGSPRHRDSTITYVQEDEPLGTAGPLRLIDDLSSTCLVMNGDVLTTLDYREFLRHHRESGNALTIASHQRTIRIDYGVLHLDPLSNGTCRIESYEEKPSVVSTVSMGIYLIEPGVLDYVPPDGYFDFPDLVQELLAGGEQVGAYVFDGLWFDIGREDDYQLAAQAWEELVLGEHAALSPPREQRVRIAR